MTWQSPTSSNTSLSHFGSSSAVKKTIKKKSNLSACHQQNYTKIKTVEDQHEACHSQLLTNQCIIENKSVSI